MKLDEKVEKQKEEKEKQKRVQALLKKLDDTLKQLQKMVSSPQYVNLIQHLVTKPPLEVEKFTAVLHPSTTKTKIRPTIENFFPKDPGLISLLEKHWSGLSRGLYTRPSDEDVLQWNTKSVDKATRYHFTVEQIIDDSERYWWQRAFAELHILEEYNSIYEAIKRRSDKNHNGKTYISRAYDQYVDDLCTSFGGDNALLNKDLLRLKVKRNIKNAKRWTIIVKKLGIGAVLACGRAVTAKM
ncbi:hypothetical protein FE257_002178 [Aspergillus nanangensis]|uniref:Uncharacterized protein n=1 Tax=Aspergillus nanangensis TaxID=2582783 RepID=A0AAD4GP74_ASPNN|nr:hypothetical protein FE257_002178 [Aspergillus nanangensis]